MPTCHSSRSGIADEVDGVEYEQYEKSHPENNFVTKAPEREFTKEELITIHNHLNDGFFLSRELSAVTPKRTVRDSIRRLMVDCGYDGFEDQDGNPLRFRELLTVLTACRDANENLRWADTTN